jgi:hypothetical protein
MTAGRNLAMSLKIKEFGPYLDDRERFLKDSARFMINTGFGL